MRLIFISILFISSVAAEAQIGNGLAFYVEGAGSAGDYSFNFEYGNLHTGLMKIDFRVGFGAGKFYQAADKPRHFMGIPVGVHAVTNWKSPSRLEMGLDVSYIEGRAEWNEQLSKTLVLVPVFGYRFLLPGGKLLVRAVYTPLIPMREYGELSMNFPQESKATNWFGLSIGYYFSRPVNEPQNTNE